jgi:hypothetical protein
MLDRVQKLRQPIGKSAQVFELGPSFNPLAPKSEGWRSFVVDPKAGPPQNVAGGRLTV